MGAVFTHWYVSVLEDALRAFLKVEVPMPQYNYTALQGKVLHSDSYLSKSTEVLSAKWSESIKRACSAERRLL